MNNSSEQKSLQDPLIQATQTPVSSGSWLPPSDPSTDSAQSEAAKPLATTGLISLIREYASLSDLLRFGGALSVIVAMALFLVDGTQLFTDVQRFLTMLGFTGLLTAAGFAMSLLLKEQRGSRVFIGLALASVPVNFAVFGALLYSLIPLDGMAQDYPGFALWQLSSINDVLLALVAGAAVLVPVVWMGFSVLARSARGWLTSALLLGCLALTIPVRHELIIAVLALLTACTLWWLMRRNSSESLVFQTLEGKFALALLFVSPALMMGRSLFLYSASSAVLFMLAVTVYFVIRQLLVTRETANLFTMVATFFASAAAVAVGFSGSDLMHHLIKDELVIVFGIGMVLVINHDLVRVSANKGFAKTLALIAVGLSVCVLTALCIFSTTAMLLSVCVVTLLAIGVYGYIHSYSAVLSIAAAGIVTITACHAESIQAIALQTGWWGVAILGVVAIVAGSLVERAGKRIEVTAG